MINKKPMENTLSEHSEKHVSPEFVKSLISGICHDVGAPVRHIVQFSRMLADADSAYTAAEKQTRWLSIINESGGRLQDMLKALSVFSRLSVSVHDSKKLDLKLLLERLLDFHQAHTLAKNRQVEINVQGDWPEIEGSEDHWQTLFSCLIENALYFQPEDLSHTIRLTICCDYNDSLLDIRFEDNGIGVPENQFPVLTKPFKRTNHLDEYPSLGMGLAYCQYIAELDHALLKFSSSPSGGFIVRYTQQGIRRT
ncbi:sensor histidine kinase [Agaribacter flavus]|uniref:histidine kinase n=1 Tax=Agaribacter flavus TaxID=1902781 RepID=A0ABV7FPU9_9ALTE